MKSLIKPLIRRFFYIFIIAFLIGTPGSANAVPKTFEYSGILDNIVLGTSPFSLPVSVSGSFTFDSDAAVSFPTSTTAAYNSSGLPFGMNMIVGSTTYAALNVRVFVTNDAIFSTGTSDVYIVRGTIPSPSSPDFDNIGVILADSTHSIFSDFSLPLTPPPLGRFDTLRIELDIENEISMLSGPLNTLSAPDTAAVPEPSTLFFIGCGIIGLAFRGRKRVPK